MPNEKKPRRRITTNLGPGLPRNRVPSRRVTPRQQLRIRVHGATQDLIVRTDSTVTLSVIGAALLTREPIEKLRLDVPVG